MANLDKQIERTGAHHGEHGSSFLQLLVSPILDVNAVAKLLYCQPDSARRIPQVELPSFRGPGKFRLYLLDDVIAYACKKRSQELQVTELVLSEKARVADLLADEIRKQA